jgi:hypothetical protein
MHLITYHKDIRIYFLPTALFRARGKIITMSKILDIHEKFAAVKKVCSCCGVTVTEAFLLLVIFLGTDIWNIYRRT